MVTKKSASGAGAGKSATKPASDMTAEIDKAEKAIAKATASALQVTTMAESDGGDTVRHSKDVTRALGAASRALKKLRELATNV